MNDWAEYAFKFISREEFVSWELALYKTRYGEINEDFTLKSPTPPHPQREKEITRLKTFLKCREVSMLYITVFASHSTVGIASMRMIDLNRPNINSTLAGPHKKRNPFHRVLPHRIEVML